MTVLAFIAYLYSAIAIAILSLKVRELVGIFKKGAPDPTRSNNARARWANLLKEVLGHTKMTRFTGTGIAHWFVMIGFGALLGTLITAFGQVIDPHFFIPGIGHFAPYLWIVEAIAWLTGIGIVALIGIRQVTRLKNRGRSSRFYGSGSWKAYYVEATILAIVLCVIALR
ncbi:MAG: Fe-S oxidoreductase, partial [Actinobacteria bacterium]|nr:Fe-S oxidoreductase [Actinomycetota bacterium]